MNDIHIQSFSRVITLPQKSLMQMKRWTSLDQYKCCLMRNVVKDDQMNPSSRNPPAAATGWQHWALSHTTGNHPCHTHTNFTNDVQLGIQQAMLEYSSEPSKTFWVNGQGHAVQRNGLSGFKVPKFNKSFNLQVISLDQRSRTWLC